MSTRLGQVVALLVLVCWLACAAVSEADAAPKPHAVCSIHVSGSADRSQRIREASWRCSSSSSSATGPPAEVTAAVDRVLDPFRDSFTGVTWDSSCRTPGCLITICGSSSVVLAGSRLSYVDVRGLRAVLCVTNSSRVTLQDSTIEWNNMTGLYATGHAVVAVEGGAVSSNYGQPRSNGGGIRLDGDARLSVVDSTLDVNWARGVRGGGLYVGGRASAVITSSQVLGNYCDSGDGAECYGGGIAAVDNATVLIEGNTVLQNNLASTAGGALALAGQASVTVQDTVLFAANLGRGGRGGFDALAEGRSSLQLPAPFFEEQGGPAGGPAGPARISKCSRGVLLKTLECGVGERPDDRDKGVCLCCPERSFSFDATGRCRPCPAGAQCPGGYALQPLPGFFRSSLWSDQVHRCPLSVDACAGNDKCVSGYTGNLCGACDSAEGYGMVSALRCSKCMQPRAQLGVYVLIALVTVLFVAITVHYTWKDNLEGCDGTVRPSDIIKILVTFMQCLVIIGSCSAPRWPPFMASMFRASAVVFGAAAGQAISLDCWLAHYKPFGASLPRAMQLQLFTFLAPLLVFAAVCFLAVLWWGVRLGVSAASQSCAQCGPQCTVCGSKQVRCGRVKPTPFSQLPRKLPVTALIVAYYAYPSLLRASMSFFACLRIDKALEGGSVPLDPTNGDPVPLLSHPHGYSVLDIQQQCFAGYHRGWALGLGIPAMLVTCLGVPLGLAWLLTAKAGSADDPAVREHYAFLFRNYRRERMWWEAMWAGQMVLQSLVDAFHFKLEAYNSMLLLCLIFVVGAALQSLFKPYNLAKLHQVHYASFACLFLTCLGALAMFPVDKSAEALSEAHITIAVLVLAMNAGFVGYALHAVLSSRAVTALCVRAASLLGVPVGPVLSQPLGPADSASSQAHHRKGSKGSAAGPGCRSAPGPAEHVPGQLPPSSSSGQLLPVEAPLPSAQHHDAVQGLFGRLLAGSSSGRGGSLGTSLWSGSWSGSGSWAGSGFGRAAAPSGDSAASLPRRPRA